jgi:hypothetical protein
VDSLDAAAAFVAVLVVVELAVRAPRSADNESISLSEEKALEWKKKKKRKIFRIS